MLKQIGYMINMEETNKTIDYYNRNAAQYFSDTVNVNMSECCDRFLKYVIPGGRIIDIGAGSGRDIKYFKDRGYVVDGIDASEEMCRLAADYSGVEVSCERIQDWHPTKLYNGIWASASLLHLTIDEIEDFLLRTPDYLEANGVLSFSMKKGIRTGKDSEGRFFTAFSSELIRRIKKTCVAFELVDSWITEDGLGRFNNKWVNIILKRNGV